MRALAALPSDRTAIAMLAPSTAFAARIVGECAAHVHDRRGPGAEP